MDVDKCCITHFPAPVLEGAAAGVDEIADDIRRLVDRMIDVMIEQKGIGLAAPQIGFDDFVNELCPGRVEQHQFRHRRYAHVLAPFQPARYLSAQRRYARFMG